MHRPLRHLIALFALAYFFTPLSLLAGGVRATEFENRRLADRPKLNEGWDVFDSMTQYAIDHMPLRERAVRANAWKSLNVFRTTPTYAKRAVNAMEAIQITKATEDAPPATASQVLVGADDWYFLQADVDRACAPLVPPARAAARWARLGRIVADSGRRVVVVIAPDKSTIYPEHLPADFQNEACMRTGRTALWAALESSPEPTLLPLREIELAAKTEFEHPIYYRTNSHWNSGGYAVFVRAVIDVLGRRPLPADAIFERGTQPHQGDLGMLLGVPMEEAALDVAVDTRGVRHLPGRVAFIHDSFGHGPLSILEAQSGSFSSAQWADDPPARVIAAIRRSDTVILETVEREVSFRASEVLTDAFLSQLTRALATTP